MQHHTFTVINPGAKRPAIVAADTSDIAEDAWKRLHRHIVTEGEMQPYPADHLMKRWRDGLASIVLHEGQIVVYVGLDATYNKNTRGRLANILGVKARTLPEAIVYKGVSGWTRSDWRRRGLGVKARKPLYRAVLGEHELYLASTSGIGAVPLWERLGWCVISWEKYAFLASLEGWYADFDENGLASRFYTPGIGWEAFAPHAPWNGGHVSPFTHKDHPWERYAHLGVSSETVADRLNTAFAEAAGYDLGHWRDAITKAFPGKFATSELARL